MMTIILWIALIFGLICTAVFFSKTKTLAEGGAYGAAKNAKFFAWVFVVWDCGVFLDLLLYGLFSA